MNNNENIKYNYIIYHKNCLDGFSGFIVFLKTKFWDPKPTIYPDIPSTKVVPPNIEGKNVIIIDVAYNADIIKEIAEKANNVLFIDHHVTIQKDVENLNLGENNKIVYDLNESGASLVWKYFFGNKKRPRFLDYVKDNDIGTWELQETFPFIAGIDVNFTFEPSYENIKKWDNLFNDDFLSALVERGRVYDEYKLYLIKKSSKNYSIKNFPSEKIIDKFKGVKVGEYTVAVTNVTCPSTSLVGKHIAENVECDFVLLYNYVMDKKKYVISLRSISADVGEIAKALGGGGHKFASGCAISSNEYVIDDLFV